MPTVWIKQGVMGELNPAMRKCFGRLAQYYFARNKDFFVTSIREGNHSPGSLHYDGGAVDFKRQRESKAAIKAICGPGFDVVEYDDESDIFHVEYDPKG